MTSHNKRINWSLDLLKTTREVFASCGPFGDGAELRAMFIDPRIRLWRNRLPDANNLQRRISETVAFLADEHDHNGQNGLYLFLHVLRDQTHPRNYCHTQLTDLIAQCEAARSEYHHSGEPTMKEQTNIEEINTLQKQAANIRQNLNVYKVREAEFINPMDIPLQWTANKQRLEQQLQQIETQLARLTGTQPQTDVESILRRLDAMEANLGGKLDDLKVGVKVIYQSLTIKEREQSDKILEALGRGRIEQAKMERAVLLTRLALSELLRNQKQLNSDMQQSFIEIEASLNSSLPFQQGFELSVPIIPALLAYKTNIGAGVELGAVWEALIGVIKTGST